MHKDNELRVYCRKFAIFAVVGPLRPIFVLLRVGELMRTSKKAYSPGTLPLVNSSLLRLAQQFPTFRVEQSSPPKL
jgi:hypothetical protein